MQLSNTCRPQSIISTGYSFVENSLSHCAQKVVGLSRSYYHYYGQKVIDFSDAKLANTAAKVVHQVVTNLALATFLFVTPAALTISAATIYAITYDIDCEDDEAVKIMSAVCHVLFLKSAINFYDYAQFKSAYSLTGAIFQLSAGCCLSLCLHYLQDSP